MFLVWLFTAVVQCFFLYVLWHCGRKRIVTKTSSIDNMSTRHLPMVGMIIPAAGNSPAMPHALRSLLVQNYPHIIPVIVTASTKEPAAELVRTLQQEFPHVRHVVAGTAQKCGQKNHNILCGIADINNKAEIFAFCDSTHMAKPDFIQHLVRPLIMGEATCSTGYHQVIAEDDQPVTRGYQICVLLMRLLQAVAVLTQPWGGAMAMTRTAFEQHDVATYWGNNVVDDCSLAALLVKQGVPVQLCPDALLDTVARNHPMQTWRAWLERQVLFLKFCIPVQWILLGIFAGIMTIPPVLSAIFVVGSVLGTLPAHLAWLTLGGIVHLGCLIYIMLGWREFLPAPVGASSWLTAFVCAVGMFARVYVDTCRRDSIIWHDMLYHVDKEGIVRSMKKSGKIRS